MTRRKERFCKWGHDTHLTGRYGNGCCVICSKSYDHKRRADDGLLPPRRLFSVVKRNKWTWEYVAVRYGARQDVAYASALLAVRRLKESKGLTVDQADVWCLTLGTDLYVVFPEAYRLKGVVA